MAIACVIDSKYCCSQVFLVLICILSDQYTKSVACRLGIDVDMAPCSDSNMFATTFYTILSFDQVSRVSKPGAETKDKTKPTP